MKDRWCLMQSILYQHLWHVCPWVISEDIPPKLEWKHLVYSFCCSQHCSWRSSHTTSGWHGICRNRGGKKFLSRQQKDRFLHCVTIVCGMLWWILCDLCNRESLEVSESFLHKLFLCCHFRVNNLMVSVPFSVYSESQAFYHLTDISSGRRERRLVRQW